LNVLQYDVSERLGLQGGWKRDGGIIKESSESKRERERKGLKEARKPAHLA